jgi:hypothetical protein
MAGTLFLLAAVALFPFKARGVPQPGERVVLE